MGLNTHTVCYKRKVNHLCLTIKDSWSLKGIKHSGTQANSQMTFYCHFWNSQKYQSVKSWFLLKNLTSAMKRRSLSLSFRRKIRKRRPGGSLHVGLRSRPSSGDKKFKERKTKSFSAWRTTRSKWFYRTRIKICRKVRTRQARIKKYK